MSSDKRRNVIVGIDVGSMPVGLAMMSAAGAHLMPTTKPERDTPPDRLSLDPTSPHYDHDLLQRRGVGVVFKGTERFNVYEYCISEGWVRVIPRTQAGQKRPTTVKLEGVVEAFFRDVPRQGLGPRSIKSHE